VRNVVVTGESDRNRLRDRPGSDDLETLAANWPANFGGNVRPRRHDRLDCGAHRCRLMRRREGRTGGGAGHRCCTSMVVHTWAGEAWQKRSRNV
jgi:hypothetical protein